MIIEKIELENFMCYAGINTMEFREGINVIIGDNGYGKSKLYDAFYWVMYDHVFVTEKKEFQSTKTVKSAIISDKVKSEVKEGKITTSVSITFHNIERNIIYILERKYSIFIRDGIYVENNNSEFIIMQKELSYLNAKMVNDEEEKNRIIKLILPPSIKDYLWFQGEQVESIIDFNKQDTLTKAINVLSNITRYDEINGIAISAAKAVKSEYDREVRRLSRDIGESERLGREKLYFEEQINELMKKETEVRNNLSRAEEKSESLLGKIKDANTINEYQQKKKSILLRLTELSMSLNQEQISFHRKMFRNKWVLKGTRFLHEDYSNLYQEYEKKKLEAAAELKARTDMEGELMRKLQTRLPIDVPEPIYVQRMLDEEKCLVCDRVAEKDSEPWKKIKELIYRSDTPTTSVKNESAKKQNFTDDFKRLYQNGLALSHRIQDIDADINETLEKINGLKNKIKNVSLEIEKVDESIQKILSDTSQTIDGAYNIIAEYTIQNNYAKDYKESLNKTTQQLENFRNKLKNVDEQLKDLVTGEIPKWLVEKKNVLEDFETITKATRDRVFSSLIAQLEKGANFHYMAMTSGNRSARGHIKLRQLPNGNYMPEIIDDNGSVLLGSNTSNLILVKLSAIMAIISAKSNDGAVSFYTLITDAPTSVFGEDYTIGFCKTISMVYKQSIIMSKEFYKNTKLRNDLLTSPDIKIGKVYMVTPSIPENERSNRNNLSTKIEALN